MVSIYRREKIRTTMQNHLVIASGSSLTEGQMLMYPTVGLSQSSIAQEEANARGRLNMHAEELAA